MRKGTYLQLQMKRHFKCYPSVLLVTFVLMIGILVSVFAVMLANQTGDGKKMIRIGVVGDVEDSYLGVGVYAIQNMDSSRFYVDLVEMNESAAKEALNSKEISGYVYIPDDFVDGIVRGRNIPLEYVTNEGPAGFGNILEREIVMMVSDLVTEAQKSVYSTIDLAQDYKAMVGIDKKIERLNLSNINFVLNRNAMHELRLIGVQDELTYGGYYLCAIIAFFLMIWGISCNKLLTEQTYEMSRLLYLRGMGAFWQMFVKFLSFAAVTGVTLILFALCVGLVADVSDFGIIELSTTDGMTAVAFVIKILPVVFMFVAMHIMLYEIFNGSVGGILAQFLIAIGLGYISGVFYPNTFFPESIQNFASYLPTGTGFSYIRKTMAGAGLSKDMILVTIYGIVFYLTSVMLRSHKIKGDCRI